MKITNNFNLPEPIVNAMTSEYKITEGRYSVTSIQKGVKEVMLERRHNSEIEVDASDMVWAIFGQAVHALLENAQETASQFKEVSIREEIDGRTLAGRIDLYDGATETIEDYKTCSVWKVMFNDFTDWERQLLIYAYLLKLIGFRVKWLRNIAFLKDHSMEKAKYDSQYPAHPVFIKVFDVTDGKLDDIEKYVKNKIALFKKYETFPDDNIPPCTPDERWYSGTKFAVMKKGRKSALRLLDTEQDAKDWIAANTDGKQIYIHKRQGVDRKCQDYCRASTFCHYWKRRQLLAKMKEERGITNE